MYNESVMFSVESRGGIRIHMNRDGKYGTIEMTIKPTAEQKKKLRSFINAVGGNVNIDFMDENYNTTHAVSYEGVSPTRALSGITTFYDKGIKPKGNVSYSLDMTNNQGNPINEDGSLKIEEISSIADLTDNDFIVPYRNVQLPNVPQLIKEVLGLGDKPVIIKKNIFERNMGNHADVKPEQSRDILYNALYNTNLYGQTQKIRKPYNWVVLNIKGESANKLVLLEINDNKNNAEIVHWHYIDNKGVEKLRRQAGREGGQLLILPSKEEVGALSDLTTNLSSTDKDTTTNPKNQISEQESYSINRTDIDYLDAVNRGDMATAQNDDIRYSISRDEVTVATPEMEAEANETLSREAELVEQLDEAQTALDRLRSKIPKRNQRKEMTFDEVRKFLLDDYFRPIFHV